MSDSSSSLSSRSSHASPRRRTALRLSLVVVALAFSLSLVELALQLEPRLLPVRFLNTYPGGGIEFLEPGLLTRTPIDEMPLPIVRRDFDGRPPADLKEIGVAPPDVDHDALRFPRIFIPADANGLFNDAVPERADIVLVGDSFIAAAGAREPKGLAVRLGEELKLSVYSVAVAGIGPTLEAWMLERVGLPLEPRLVIWFFFGANDLDDDGGVLRRREAGRRMRSDLSGYRAPPRLVLPALVRWLFRSRTAGPKEYPEGLAPLPFDGAPSELWFHPRYLGRLAIDRAAWEGHVAWTHATDELRTSRDRVLANGGEFALVYLPSKGEALLPLLQSEPELVLRSLNHGLAEPLVTDADAALARLMRNRTALDEALASFAAEEGIPYFSATDALTEAARGGDAGFLSTDTHWSTVGQEAVLGPLVEFLRENRLVGE